MKHRATCFDLKESETVFSQICDSKKDAQDLIDCENDLAADNGESQTFYDYELEKRIPRYEWKIQKI